MASTKTKPEYHYKNTDITKVTCSVINQARDKLGIPVDSDNHLISGFQTVKEIIFEEGDKKNIKIKFENWDHETVVYLKTTDYGRGFFRRRIRKKIRVFGRTAEAYDRWSKFKGFVNFQKHLKEIFSDVVAMIGPAVQRKFN